MTVRDDLEHKLRQAFRPSSLRIVDESARHAGHAGARPEGETHFAIAIVADAFIGKSRLERQRLIHDVLAEELQGPVHALSIRALAPDETGRG